MKITQDVRDYAKAKGLPTVEDAVDDGLAAKANEFREGGGEIYREAGTAATSGS